MRCTRLVQRMAETARANLARLGETPAEDFVTRYVAQTRGATNVCPTLREEKLACLEAAADPLVALGDCAINEGRPFSERLLPPMVASELVRWQVHRQDAPSEAVTRAALRALAGTWEKTDGTGTKRLTITAEGAVTYVVTRNGETTTKEGRVDVRSAHRVRFELAGTTFDFGFHVFGERVLFSNQTATGAYPIARRGTTRVAQNGQFFVVEDLRRNPRCRGFGARLEEMPVRCGWEGEGDSRRFVITRGAMRWIESGTAAREYPIRFVEDRGVLVADGDSMVWSRVP
ncbi:MAG: hypothetical protein H6721_27990 [Sandaracinus sp.]|nr:hypothetical protein [Sandaracinus sp.]MCB9635969.1 hypothetical protein [Sandaracinus sp.]